MSDYFVDDSTLNNFANHYGYKSSYSLTSNRLYVAYLSRPDEETTLVKITYFDYDNNEWVTPVLITELEDYDQHYVPTILIDNDGYIHLFYGCHNDTGVKHKRSINTENISTWTDEQEIGTGETYPHAVVNSSGDIFLFSRRTITDDNRPLYLYKSTDNGINWDAGTNIIDLASDQTVYTQDVIYDSDSEVIHISFANMFEKASTATIENIYYVYYKISDGKIYTIDGSDLGIQATKAELEANNGRIAGGDDGTNEHTAPHMVLVGGQPYFMYSEEVAENDFDLMFAKWDAGWNTVKVDDSVFTNRWQAPTNGDSITKHFSADGGVNWNKETVIDFTEYSIYGCSTIQKVFNYSDIGARFLIAENKNTEAKLYAFESDYTLFAEDITLSLNDFTEINEAINIEFCESNTAKPSKYGTFIYGQKLYGKRVDICEEILEIKEQSLRKINDTLLFYLNDEIEVSENIERQVDYKPNLLDSASMSESLSRAWEAYILLADSVTFSDGDEKYKGKSLSDSISFTTLIEIDFEEGITEKSKWKFIIKDDSGNKVASLVNARKRWFVQRLNDASEAGFILDADDDNCNSTVLSLGVNELYIYYKEVLMWGGQLVSAKKIAQGDDIYWEVLAKDWVSLLSKRFVGIDEPLEYTTTDAGEIAWDLIDTTQSEIYGDFGITQGTIQSSITRSPVYERKNILEAIKELSNQGEEATADTWGFDFEITPEKEFNVYYPYMGTVRQGVVFRYPGNCENFEALVDSWTIVNNEWGFGKHWTGNDAVVERSDADSQNTYGRREKLKSYSDVSVLAFLQDMVWQDIQWLKEPSQIIRFDARVDEKVKITDYNVGDGVVVVNDKFDIDELLWVFERKVEIGDNDELDVRLTVGD